MVQENDNMFQEFAEKVRKEAFAGSQEAFLKERCRMMYQRVLELVPEVERVQVVQEIIALEKKNRQRILQSAEKYANRNTELILNQYSDISMDLAMQALETKQPSLLAKYLSAAYLEILDNKQVEAEIEKYNYQDTVSETILDLNYSEGNFDVMSLRLYAAAG